LGFPAAELLLVAGTSIPEVDDIFLERFLIKEKEKKR
jgi:hypothetical protein